MGIVPLPAAGDGMNEVYPSLIWHLVGALEIAAETEELETSPLDELDDNAYCRRVLRTHCRPQFDTWGPDTRAKTLLTIRFIYSLGPDARAARLAEAFQHQYMPFSPPSDAAAFLEQCWEELAQPLPIPRVDCQLYHPAPAVPSIL